MQRSRAFTIIELLVVISIIALLIAILLPALGSARLSAQQLASNTQLRGIHQGMVIFAQENKTGGGDGYFPGLSADGKNLAAKPTGADQFQIGGPGSQTFGSCKHRYALLLNGNFVVPDYLGNPVDPDFRTRDSGIINSEFFSYCMNQLGRDSDGTTHGSYGYNSTTQAFDNRDLGRIAEWKETLNSSAAVMSDMNTGDNAFTTQSSWWTEENSGQWEGGIAMNDNSVSFSNTVTLPRTQYGAYPETVDDNIFNKAGNPGADAMMVLGRVGWGSRHDQLNDQRN